MPIDPHFANKFSRLEGTTSMLEALADAGQMAKIAAYQEWSPGYVAPEVEVSDETATGPHGAIPVRVYRPLQRASTVPALVWAHGGGFLAGDLDMPEADILSRELVHRAGIAVVSVGYRLAVGGVTYPVPLDDVVAAFTWTAHEAARLGLNVNRISLGGASAGANLACGAALRIRDAQSSPAPYRLLLAYPFVHATLPTPSEGLAAAMAQVPGALRFSSETISFLVENYIGGPVDPSTAPAYAAPINGDLRGLPATTIVTSEFDDLRPSGEELASLLEAADVDVTLFQQAGALHGQLNEDPRIPVVEESLTVLANELR